jgi:hypothetical protein
VAPTFLTGSGLGSSQRGLTERTSAGAGDGLPNPVSMDRDRAMLNLAQIAAVGTGDLSSRRAFFLLSRFIKTQDTSACVEDGLEPRGVAAAVSLSPRRTASTSDGALAHSRPRLSEPGLAQFCGGVQPSSPGAEP